MRIAVGCLAWIVGFCALLFLERAWLRRLPALPDDAALGWSLAVVLALVSILALGSLLGLLGTLAKLLRGQGQEPVDPESHLRWQDGQRVQVEGVLEARDQVLTAPFTQRPAVFVRYGAYARRYEMGNRDERNPPRLDGLLQVPALLRVGAQRIALKGIPAPRGVAEERFDLEAVGAAAAVHLQRTTWQAAGLPAGGLAEALDLFRQVPLGADADAGRHVMSSRARDLLADFTAVPPQELQARLSEQLWHFSEWIWAPGQRFTATGTWHSQPPYLDIGYGPLSAEHGLQAGTVAQLSRRALWTAVIFTLVLGGLAAGAHLALADQGGGRFAGWWSALE